MNAILNRPVLVLNRLWQPVQTCSVRRAIQLLCLGHAEVVETEGENKYQTHNFTSWVQHSLANMSHLAEEVIHSVRVVVVVPKIIVLAVYDRMPRNEVKFTRHNVFLRDQFTCQYCHKTFIEKELNLDHVIPRDKGGKTTWENIVTSCIRCNTRKANKLPHEVNMRLFREPKRPRWRPLFCNRNDAKPHQSWEQFIAPDKEKVKMAN